MAIGTVITLGKLLLDVASFAAPDKSKKDIETAKNTLNKAERSYNVMSTNSVTQSAARATISPMIVIEDSLLHNEYMHDLIEIVTLRDIVATLTHLALENGTGMGIKVADLVGSINPNRGGMMALMGCEMFNNGPSIHFDSVSGNEDKNSGLPVPKGYKPKDGEDKKDLPKDQVRVKTDQIPQVMEYTPLAVGKVVSATAYGPSGEKMEYPLTFREIPVPVPYNDIALTFSAAKGEDGFFARMMMVKTGEITFPEFLTGKDIIKERFRIKNDQMSKYYKTATAAEAKNKAIAVQTGVMSFNNLANTFIFSKDSANQLELQMGKRFADPKSRHQIFNAVKANTIVVCNDDRGIYQFYTHGVDMPETYTRKEITLKAKKDPGNSLEDLVKLLNGGR